MAARKFAVFPEWLLKEISFVCPKQVIEKKQAAIQINLFIFNSLIIKSTE